MATFELNIRCGNIDEFSEIAARLCGASLAGYEQEDEDQGGAAGQPSDTEAGEAPAKPKRTRKAKAGAEPTQQPSGEPIPPTTEPLPQPTPGGTEAPPAESIPPKQEPATKDVFDTSATPSAGSPEADAAAAAGDVTMQQLKDAMADLLKVKSAAFAMKTIEDATGCKSLSSGSPSVAEKAKTDPAIMRTALDALVAGKTAA